MPLLNWTEENFVGIEELDKQHQKMFSIINNLYDSMSQSKANEEIKNILGELTEYANYHLQTEENYFEQFNYENKEEHVLLHHQYRDKIANFINDSKSDSGTVISFEVIDYLENWWFNHINSEDKRYTECFKNHGLK